MKVEAFFPWDDLNGIGVPGALWQFCHARFSWTKGFRGMVNSPEANYNATSHFGYIFFSDGKNVLGPGRIGDILMEKAAAWRRRPAAGSCVAAASCHQHIFS